MLAITPKERVAVLFEELAELSGQRNAIDARIVEIAAEVGRDELIGMTGARSMTALIAWKTGVSPANAGTAAAIAERLEEFPRCAAQMRQGRVSLDQLGVIATRGGPGCDAHYVELAQVATVTQLRTAVTLEPRPDPEPLPSPAPSITKTSHDQYVRYRLTVTHDQAAVFDAALASYRDALINDWKRNHEDNADQAPPFPTTGDAFMSLVEAGWDTEVARRPHGQHTTVVVHLDVNDRVANLHLGPLLSEADRQFLTCDATCEVWFERDGQPSARGGPPAPSTAACAAPWNTATPPVRSPGVGPPAPCTPTTSCIGKTAEKPSCTTWC